MCHRDTETQRLNTENRESVPDSRPRMWRKTHLLFLCASVSLWRILFCLILSIATPRLAADIHMLTWSDYIDPEIPKQFEKETGIAVKIDVYEETESMMAKLQAGGGASQYDLVVASDHAVPILAKLK